MAHGQTASGSRLIHHEIFAFIIGFLILTAGLAWAAIEAGAPALYVQIGSVIFLGIGIIAASSRTRAYRTAPDVTTVVHDDDRL